MKKLIVLVAISLSACAAQTAPQPVNPDVAKFQQRAQGITIVRDKWDVPHIYGKTDADVVFGLLYTQCEDDFDRVEMNYLSALGRVAEANGEGAIYEDLRARFYADTLQIIKHFET